MNFNKNTTVEDILNLKKPDIQYFLKKNNAKISGSKLELATRAFEVNLKSHGSVVSVERETSDIDNPTTLSPIEVPPRNELNTGWSSDLHNVPNVTHKDVESYLIHSSHRTNDNQQMKCYRQYIRGFSFHKEGYIHKIMINEVNKDYVYVRSKCFPSMKKGTYSQWLLLKNTNPVKVLKAECTCPAGLGEGCTHIAALLFSLEAQCSNSTELDSDTPSTSKPCEWNKPQLKRKLENKPVSEMSFKKHKYGGDKEGTNANGNHKSKIEVDQHSFFQMLCGKLEKSDANPVMLHLFKPNNAIEQIPTENDINVAYFEEVNTCTSEEMQPDINKYIYLENENYEKSDDFLSFISNVTEENIVEIEAVTRGQSSNTKWVACRQKRITASNFHDILRRRESTTSEKLATRLLESDGSDISAASLSWGKKYEPIAKKKFIALIKLKNKKSIKVQDVGIFLCPKYGFIGASPDGIIESQDSRELIEIKCPYKWRNCTVKEACASKDFYCTFLNDEFNLKPSHRNFTQIQGQMLVTGIHFCKLVIFTLKDMVVINIKYDADFCSNLLSKLETFYKTDVLPLLFKKTT